MEDKITDSNTPSWPNSNIPPEEVLANVMHRLVRPLTSIKGFAELLSGQHGEIPPERQTEMVVNISKHTEYSLEMIYDVLEYLKNRTTLE